MCILPLLKKLSLLLFLNIYSFYCIFISGNRRTIDPVSQARNLWVSLDSTLSLYPTHSIHHQNCLWYPSPPLHAYCLWMFQAFISHQDYCSYLLTLLTASSFSSLQYIMHIAYSISFLKEQSQDSTALLKTSADSRRKFHLLGHPSQPSLNHPASSFHFSLQPHKHLALLAIPHRHSSG